MQKTRYVIKKESANALTKYVVFSLGTILVFTLIMIVLFIKYQTVPDTLITCFFAVFGGEVLSCALIKIFKLKRDDTD